uniref:Uncharacterized protein n=1 Tax=Oryza nivara TaxID=4536 RepID=A0A0E0ICU1_ORYNI
MNIGIGYYTPKWPEDVFIACPHFYRTLDPNTSSGRRASASMAQPLLLVAASGSRLHMMLEKGEISQWSTCEGVEFGMVASRREPPKR